MTKLPCPSCGAELEFQSSTSVFRVCPYCQSCIVRHDLDLDIVGEMAGLPADLSPIQVGMTGRYRTLFFYVSGRIIYNWKDGTWNEWHLYFDNGETGWLSEAQGEFSISRPLESHLLPGPEMLELGKVVKVKGERFKLSDIKEASYLGSEGELPFKALADYRCRVFDFSSDNEKFLSLERSEDESDLPLAYMGEYVEFSRLEAQNIRFIEGWNL